MARQVAVCGPNDCTGAEQEWAARVGELLAQAGAVTLCGGGGGVMAAAAHGASSQGGLVVGIRPDADRGPFPDLTVTVRSSLGQARNVVLVTSSDAVIAIGGSWGTLSEVALAMRLGTPVVWLGGWRLVDRHGSAVPGVTYVETPDEAVDRSGPF
jgi:uncharacterized protein (TIGR00725 family)